VRILVVSDWYPERPGDPSGSFVRNQALAIARRHEVAVLHLAPPHPGGGRARLRLADERDGALRTLRLRRAAGLPLSAGNLAAVVLALRRLRGEGFEPDLLHAHEAGAGFAAVAVGRPLRLPVVISEHFSGFALGQVHGVAARVARIAFARADLVCPVSVDLRERMEADGWPGRFRVVPNVVDVKRFTPAGEPPDGQPRMVAVAALRPVKGVADLIEAAGLVAREGADFRLDLVGDGPLREQLAERVRVLGLEEHITLQGTRSADEVAALMRAAAFAVVPSVWETFSVVLGEAMACGLPVVATDVGGMSERVHAGNGALVPPRDPLRLAEALTEMLARHRDYDRAAIAAEVRERYAPAAVAAQWEAIYAGVLRPERPRRARRRSPPSPRRPARRSARG
jgi:glycosyltransferase involved in cell wall biosynthesis